MKFEQKFIQIPTNSDWWGTNEVAPASWYGESGPKRIISQGFSSVKYEGLFQTHPQFLFSVGLPNFLGEHAPIFSEASDPLPTAFARGIFVSYYKIALTGEEIQYTDGIHIEQSNLAEIHVRLLNEDSLFPGYLNLIVWNPIPPAFARNPQT